MTEPVDLDYVDPTQGDAVIIGYGTPNGVSNVWPPNGEVDPSDPIPVGEPSDQRKVKKGEPVPETEPVTAVVNPDDEF